MAEIRKMSHGDLVTVSQIEDNPGLMDNISQYLSLMERLAVGIYSDVFDYEVYRELNKAVAINSYHMLREYIVNTRTKNNAPRNFIYFERLVKQLEDDSKVDLPDINVKKP